MDAQYGQLVIQSHPGNRLVEIAPSRLDLMTSSYIQRGFDDCFFAATGEFLWLAAHLNSNEIDVRLIETQTWSIVDSAIVNDPFGESSCHFFSTGCDDLVALWMAAGQDGQQTFWLRTNGMQISCDQELELTNTNPPAFSSDGSRVLVVDEINDICQYDITTGRKLGPRVKSIDQNDPFAESLCYFDDQRAIAATNHGRVFLIDTHRMSIVEEVVIEGHEPKPISAYFPGLANQRELGTNISWFVRLGDAIAFVFRRDGGVSLNGWKDSLVWYEDRLKS